MLRQRNILGTDLKGGSDAFNPAELLLAALAACMIKGIERVTPILKFEFHSVEVTITGNSSGCAVLYGIDQLCCLIDSDENDRLLELLHENVKKYGTVFNTVAPGTKLSGMLTRLQ